MSTSAKRPQARRWPVWARFGLLIVLLALPRDGLGKLRFDAVAPYLQPHTKPHHAPSPKKADLSEFLTATTASVTKALQVTTPPAVVEQGRRKKIAFEFFSFKLRIRPRIGFQIPAVVSLRLIPELELSWTKTKKKRRTS